jgi:predicted nucleotidyltransferase
MLEKLMKSRVRIKLLKLFFLNREKEFYLRELARITKENLNSIRMELNNLSSAGIINERKKGNQKLYQVNKASSVHEELRKLILKTVGIGDSIRKKLVKVGDVNYSLIFGSFASGEEIDESDIDLLIIGDVNEEKLIEVIENLEIELSREINYILWNKKEFEKKVKQKHHLLLDIVEKPFIMLVGDRTEFRKIVKG